MAKRNNKVGSILDTAEVETDKLELISPDGDTQEVVKEVRPIPTDVAWHDFIMAQFGEKELINGYPTCHGLRRLFEKNIGMIVSSRSKTVQFPTQDENFAAVEHTIKYVSHFNGGKPLVITEVAQSHHSNTPPPYSNYALATASTMAESRALRKGLRINVISIDEVGIDSSKVVPSNGDQASASKTGVGKPVTENQLTVVKNFCKQLNLDLNKAVNHILARKVDMKTLTYDDGQELLKALNSYSRGVANGGEAVPAEIKGA